MIGSGAAEQVPALARIIAGGLACLPTRGATAGRVQLRRVQQGLEPDDWKPMAAIGAGVREVRIHVDGEHRVFYVAVFTEGVYVLHAFRKKTQRTAKRDIELGRERFRDLIAWRQTHASKRNP